MEISRTVARCLFALLAACIVAAAPARGDDLVSETGFFRVNIGGRTVRLEGVVVKRADAVGRLPIAIFNGGRPGTALEASDSKLSLVWLRLILADLARRGWLAVSVQRRGFGLSDGPQQSADACKPGGWMHMLNADADDVQATLEFVARRPDADPTRMMTLGISAGGGLSVTLSARNPPGLVAAVDMSGAEHFEDCPQLSPSVVTDFAEMGKRSRVPNLWLFFKNDSLHPPEQVAKIHEAFVAGGGNVKLVQFDPLGSEGHTAYETLAGRRIWLPALDDFLREHRLPTWTDDDVNALAAKLHLHTPLSQVNIDYLRRYLGGPSERAMARSTASGYLVTGFGATIEEARKQAAADCQAKAPPCIIAMENERWIAP